MGDLYRALGQGEQARDAYQTALAIPERLAQAEPERADYQRDLSVSYERMGDLYRALGAGRARARRLAEALAIAERLAEAEPERADYQRDLSVSYNKMGDLYRALGQGEQAHDAYAAVARPSPSGWPRPAGAGRLPARPVGLLRTRWATCTGRWGGASRPTTPTPNHSPSPSGWPRPSRNGPTTR